MKAYIIFTMQDKKTNEIYKRTVVVKHCSYDGNHCIKDIDCAQKSALKRFLKELPPFKLLHIKYAFRWEQQAHEHNDNF